MALIAVVLLQESVGALTSSLILPKLRLCLTGSVLKGASEAPLMGALVDADDVALQPDDTDAAESSTWKLELPALSGHMLQQGRRPCSM